MTNSTRKPSIIAGLSLLIMTFAAFYSFGFVHSQVVVVNPIQTIKNIQASSLFQTGLLGWFIIILTDIIVTWAFYKVLKPINSKLATLSALLRGVYTLFLSFAVYHLVVLAMTAGSLSVPQVTQHLDAFDSLWSLGLILFGGHLFVVGLAVNQNRQRILAFLLVLAGFSYTLVHLLKNFFPLFTATQSIESILMLPMMVGELGYGLWLLFKGGKTNPPAFNAPDSAVS
ncbi:MULTISPECIES: DUF4386 domain-containing protein [unclassified Fusibacter]|uniref:DUF4386 domain-containing protein n=1 Tax=unclassified Fusibacter TaxID=2624464 RepID=UPI0010121B60|nr:MULTISPECIES: DUF4386 domain-containing protein [unclassified Fusibacter]MCK8061493.1 DUF4386 domain-containing protein [Fusibacter sp. A2]NPE23678.1 DUF4386 domain-containing protein [Fusibacter sp. A1]RXV58857.1 DUF4386 domain-containing protein [Fusibacter sp. A1]